MTTLATRMRSLCDLEDFDVEIIGQDGSVADLKTNGFPKYDFDRRAKGTMTVNEWKQKRFNATYHGYQCRVLNADGSEAHGNTKLESVRSSYEE